MGKIIHFRKSVALTIIVIEASAKIYLQGRKRQRKQKLKKQNAFKIIFEDFFREIQRILLCFHASNNYDDINATEAYFT